MKTITIYKYLHKIHFSVFMFIFMFMFSGLLHAQTLKTDNNVPALSACGDYEEFTLRIGSGVNACNSTLKIIMPDHILYEVGSAKLGGVPIPEIGPTEAGTSLAITIPQGAPTNELVITFNAKATCEAIATANLPIDQRPAVTYNLSGCGSATLTGESEAINIRFAVLNLTVTPAATQGVIGDNFSRTITMQNSGNGSVSEFKIATDVGSGLQLISSMPTNISGWTVTQTSTGIYTFTGSTLAPGESITFTQDVKMIACGNINTTFDAYYGCTTRCTLSNVDDTKTAVITYNTGIRPNIEVSLDNSPSNYCFGQDYDVIIKITNNGTGVSTAMQLNVGSHYSGDISYGSTHLIGNYEIADDASFINNVSTPTLGTSELITSVNGDRFGTTGLPVKQMVIIPELNPGQTVYLRYKQRNNLPITGCDVQPYRILFGSITVHTGSTYKHKNACDFNSPENLYDITSTYVALKHNENFSFDGYNVGSLDVNGTGSPYNGKFQFSSFYYDLYGFTSGDYLDVILEVSPSLAAGLTAGNISFITSYGLTNPTIMPDGSGKFRLRFTYGSSYWPVGRSLNISNSQLLFSTVMDCAISPDAWYKISIEVNKNTSCPGDAALVQWCKTFDIETRCTTSCPNGGLENSYATLKRVSGYGYVAQNPDIVGKPQIPLTWVDPSISALPINTDYFVPNDIIEISQVGRAIVTGLSPVTEWTQGSFSFNVPHTSYGFKVITNSGKLVIKRGTNTYNISGLPVTMSGLNVVMNFDMTLLHANGLPTSFTGFIQDDEIVSSVQISATNAYASWSGSVAFPTTYHFIHNNTNYACSGGYRAMGSSGKLHINYYVFDGNTPRNLVNCKAAPQLFRFDAVLNGNPGKNIMFPNEYRQFIFPKKMVLDVPSGLLINGFQLNILDQGVYNPNTTGWVDIPPVNGIVEIDLEQYLKQIIGDDLTTIDEGIRLELYPRMEATCEAKDIESMEGYIVYDAIIPFRDHNKSINYDTGFGPDMQTVVETMNYNTDNSKVSAQMITPTVSSPNGQAKWVIQVTNGSSFRTFNNAWIGGNTGVNVVSVQQVTSSAGTTTTGTPLTAVNGVYQIGNLLPVSTRYYLVTANITGCDNGTVELAFGHSCSGYPASVTDADCVVTTLNGEFTQVFANLQSSIVSQNPANTRPMLCEELPYTIMLSNSGQGVAKTLSVSIPLTSAEGLAYVPGSLEITPSYAGATTPAFIAAADTNVTVVGGLFPAINISVPSNIVEKLAFGERLQVKVRLTSDGCDFRSGQRIGFYPAGMNACGTRVQNTSGVASNRVIIDGAPTTEPLLALDTETVQVNITENVGDPLTATYNFKFTNQGDGVNNYPIDTTYGLNIKLPTNWEFVGNPQSLVNPSLLSYVNLDPVKGYVYKFISNLAVGSSVNINNALMQYIGNASDLNCEDDLGVVVASVYNVFTPNRAPNCTGNCDIEQVVLTSEVPFALPIIPVPTTNETEQEFCISEGATIGDLQINETNVPLKWYNTATGGTALNVTDLLTSGTYPMYAVITDGATGCESPNRLQIQVTVHDAVTANAGPDQSVLNGTNYTMIGNQPVAPATGEWTLVSSTIPGVIISNAFDYNTTVQIPLGSEVVLKWTLTNGTCSSEDEVIIKSTTSTINAEDDDFSLIYVNDADGNSNVGNVLPNNGNGADTLGDNPATTGNVTISIVTPASEVTPGANVPVLDVTTGNVSVPANTPAGTYYITYQICETEILPIENCDTAIVTVVVVSANSTNAKDDFNNTFINTPVSGSVATNDFDTEGHVQSWTPFVNTTGGHTLVLNSDGTYTFTPATGFTGTVNYPYTVCDNGSPQACDTAILTIEVLPIATNVNTVTANNDAVVTEENTPVNINVVVNDFDKEGDDFTVTTNTNPSNGNVVNNGDGTFTYTPNPGFTGEDSFVYTICDNGTPQACDTATVTITVIGDSEANNTFANDDAYNGSMNTPITGNVIDNDFDPENDTQIVTNYSQPAHGSVVVNPDGTFTYTPNNGYTGPDQFVYTICDNGNPQACDKATVYLTLNCVLKLEVAAQSALVECGANSEAAYNAWLSSNGGASVNAVCSPVTWSYIVTSDEQNCGNTSVRTVTFTATNANGQTVSTTATFTIADTVAPTFVGIMPANVTVECDAIPSIPNVTANDNCGSVTVEFKEITTNGTCPNSYTLTRTWTAIDECENETVYSQVITVQDTKAPVFTSPLPVDVIISCLSELPEEAALTATDSCSTDVTITVNDVVSNVSSICVNNQTVTRTYTATDDCGNSTKFVQVITIKDEIAPSFNETLPANVTVSCSLEVPEAAVLTATDNCGPATVTFTETRVSGSCENNYTLTRTWTAKDACGNTVQHVQNITVADTIKPVFVGVLPVNVTVSCSSEVPEAAVLTATDNCGAATVTFAETRVSGSCENNYTLTRIWTAADACGNTVQHVQNITVADTIKPVFVGVLPINVTVSCSSEVPVAAVLTATDNCGTATVTFTETRVSGSCENNYTLTRTWTATDACSNIVTHTQVITVEDTIKPVFVGALPANVTVSCSSEVPVAAVLTATDNCGAVTVTFTETRVSGSCENNYTLTRTWTATDACSNIVTHTQVVTVADTIAPVFTTAPQNAFAECGSSTAMDDYNAWLASYGGSVASDNCGEVTMSYWIEDTNTICGNSGTVIVNFAATDICGNRTIRQAGFAFTDTTAPTITTAAANLVIECSVNNEDELNAWLSANGQAVATDLCGQVTWSHNYQGQLAVCGEPITVTFTASDACGNISTTQATVKVVDTVAPILTKQAQGLSVQCGTNTTQALNNWLANNAGAEAIDNCSTVTWTNNYDASNFVTACGSTGSVIVVFTATDSCGNTVSSTATFTIADTTAPILLTPAQSQTVECGVDSTEALNTWLANNGGATASDTCATQLTWTNDYNNGANFVSACGQTGEVIVTFTATDSCGNNVSSVAKFTIVDTTKPVFDIEPENVEVECNGSGNTEEYNAWLASFANSQASDNCGNVTYSYALVDTAVLCGKTSRTTVRFTATDECGNRISKQATFTIIDTTAPEFITGPEDVIVECDGHGNINDLNAWLNSNGGATAQDLCSTEVKWSNNFRGLTTTCGGAGTAEVIFTVTDACGNSNSRTATFTIVDTTAPEFVSDLPADEIFIKCEDLKDAEILKATDICGSAKVTVSDEVVPSECGDTKYTILRTWTAEDECGNETSHTQTIHLSCKIEVFNAVTPNGDGYNDELVLKGIECYPGNSVDIYNRWGVLVYETKNYNSNGNTFKGYSNGRVTVSNNSMLPSGTYYYVIKYDYDLGNGQIYPIEQAGYLHLETNK